MLRIVGQLRMSMRLSTAAPTAAPTAALLVKAVRAVQPLAAQEPSQQWAPPVKSAGLLRMAGCTACAWLVVLVLLETECTARASGAGLEMTAALVVRVQVGPVAGVAAGGVAADSAQAAVGTAVPVSAVGTVVPVSAGTAAAVIVDAVAAAAVIGAVIAAAVAALVVGTAATVIAVDTVVPMSDVRTAAALVVWQ